jgi:hypothetical protein
MFTLTNVQQVDDRCVYLCVLLQQEYHKFRNSKIVSILQEAHVGLSARSLYRNASAATDDDGEDFVKNDVDCGGRLRRTKKLRSG